MMGLFVFLQNVSAAQPHPETGDPIRFARSTIERWYYAARTSQSPVEVLRRRVRKDAGSQPSLPVALRAAIRTQWQAHKGWTVQLHVDNLAAYLSEHPELGPLPSYSTVRRFFKAQGLSRQRRKRSPSTTGSLMAEHHLAALEVRSFEIPYVSGLWHLDFHHTARYSPPKANGPSPICWASWTITPAWQPHLQWYPFEHGHQAAASSTDSLSPTSFPCKTLADGSGSLR